MRALQLFVVTAGLPAQDALSPPQSGERQRPAAGLGPSSTPSQLEEDATPREPVFRFATMQDWLQPYFNFKDRLSADHGVTFGLDFSAVYQHLSDTLPNGEDHAATGILRLYGTWDIFGRESGNTGTLVARVEHRDTLGTVVANQFLGFQAGYQGLVAAEFSDFGWGVTNLYWKQKFAAGKFGLVVGQVDTTDYFDVYAMANPLTMFLNSDFLYPTAAPPDQGLGVAGSAWLTNNLYAIAGVADANGQPTEIGLDSIVDDHEFFSHAEIGWTPAPDRFIFDNNHFTFWHVDARQAAGTPDSWGILYSGTTFVNDTVMPFLRAGWSDGDAPLLNASIAGGFGNYLRDHGDLLGFGVSWGKPSAPGLRDQWSSELFYRMQLSPNFAITPDVQLLINPALNPAEDMVVVLGVRGRLVF